MPDLEEFEPVPGERAVRHRSGAVVYWYVFQSDEEWRAAFPAAIDNSARFDGNTDDLSTRAKRAAIRLGLTWNNKF